MRTSGIFAKVTQSMYRTAAFRALSPIAKVAYLELDMRFYQSQFLNPMSVPVRGFAASLGCSVNTARKALEELEVFGFIAVESVGSLRGPGAARGTVYRLLWQRTLDGDPATHSYRSMT